MTYRYNNSYREAEADILAVEKVASSPVPEPVVVPGGGLERISSGGFTAEIDAVVKVASVIDPVAVHRVRQKLAALRRAEQDTVCDFIKGSV